MNPWIWMVAAGLLTYGIRLSFILLFDKIEIPEGGRRALRLVPPAVLTAIVFQEVFMPGGNLDLSPGNLRLIAALLAVLVAWRSRSVVLTVGAGMATLLILQSLLQR